MSTWEFFFCYLEIPANIEASDWILGNVQELGYYRMNYDQDNWRKLIGQLKANHEVRKTFLKNYFFLILEIKYFLLIIFNQLIDYVSLRYFTQKHIKVNCKCITFGIG